MASVVAVEVVNIGAAIGDWSEDGRTTYGVADGWCRGREGERAESEGGQAKYACHVEDGELLRADSMV